MADPPFRVVSDQSEKDIERKRTRDEIGFVLRQMAANLLRIVRGAGKGYDLLDEMIACVKAFQEFRSAHGHWPESHAIQSALEFDEPSPALDAPDSHWDEWGVKSAELDVCRASLRIAAARILGQKLQEDHGHNDLRSAVDALERAREKRRARFTAQYPSSTVQNSSAGGTPSKARKGRPVIRYPDGTPVIVGGRKKKPAAKPDDIEQ